MNKQTESFYNHFSLLYPLVDIILKPQKRVLFREINSLPAGKLLDIGVGNGTHLPLYKQHKVTGVDTSAKMLEHANKQQRKHIELLQMDGEALLFDDASFDYVVLSHVLAVVEDLEKVVKEASRILKPGSV